METATQDASLLSDYDRDPGPDHPMSPLKASKLVIRPSNDCSSGEQFAKFQYTGTNQIWIQFFWVHMLHFNNYMCCSFGGEVIF